MSFHVPEKARTKHLAISARPTPGNNGFFQFKHEGVIYNCIASDGLGWEHVSVHVVEDGEQQTPTWEEMCRVKQIFWDEDDCVLQYHPAKSEYVNCHPNVLHLWRPIGVDFPRPDPSMVGPR